MQSLTVSVLIALLLAFFGSLWPLPAQAGGVVGDGTPQSCTSQALADALSTSGLVTFNCGPAPATIVITASGGLIVGGPNRIIDGANQITLSGANSTRIFHVVAADSFVGNLTLQNLSLTHGNVSGGEVGGCILNEGGILNLYNTIVEHCYSALDGGAIYSNGNGRVTLTSSTIRYNAANHTCGGICDFAGYLVLTGTLVYSNTALTDHVGGVGSVGLMTITNSTIESNTAYLDGGGVYNNVSLTLHNSTVTGNRSLTGVGGGIYSDGMLALSMVTLADNSGDCGAAIHNAAGGTATIVASAFARNRAIYNNCAGTGGAIYSKGTLDVTNGAFDENQAFNTAGAIHSNGIVTVADSTFARNAAGTYGGALALQAPAVVSVNRVTFMYNDSVHGGAVHLFGGTLTMTNATLSGNTGGQGGGLSTYGGTATLLNVTLNGNKAVTFQGGGGIFRIGGTVNLKNTIVSNSSAGNCVGGITSLGYNLSSDNSCAPYFNQFGDWNNTDPDLLGLWNNGGPTLTHMPFPPSKAIDNGQCVSGITSDQRGVMRPLGLSCDIGAVEYQPGVPVPYLWLPLVVR